MVAYSLSGLCCLMLPGLLLEVKMDIKKTVALHAEWLQDTSKGERANLENANLRNADLRNANLRDADLRDADLRSADLENANLENASLENATLGHTNLQGADLRSANLRGADLEYADLRDATLEYADLGDVNLGYANLGYANLRGVKNFYLLPVADHRGYGFAHAVNTADGWRIRAGCRYFSIDQSLEHWGDAYYVHKDIGDMYIQAIKWLQEKIK